MRILTAAQMREADRFTIEEIGIPSIVLMENAGHRVVDALRTMCGGLSGLRVSVLSGRGNNGGDGFVVARLLDSADAEVRIFALCDAESVTDDAAVNLGVLRRLGLPVTHVVFDEDWRAAHQEALSADVLVDALVGTGLRRPLEGLLRAVVLDVNATKIPVVSIDLPTGLASDESSPPGDAIEAALTVTLGAPKLSLLARPAATLAGDLVVADIGIPATVIEDLPGERLDLLTPEDVGPMIPPRPPEGHKGSFGHVLVVAGSVGKTGAAVLAARGALRAGAGLVTIAVPECCLAQVASLAPEYMTLPLPDSQQGGIGAAALEALLTQSCDAIAIGPGIGTDPEVATVVSGLLARTTRPLVLDADALNVLASCPGAFPVSGDTSVARPAIVLTPHPGEMARLTGLTTAEVQDDRISVARRFATAHGVTVLLKGAHTLIASPDGSVAINPTGNPGMATGGTGDVLTGVVAAWLAQLRRVDIACQVAVYTHGLAGDLAADAQGEAGLIATDLVDYLGRAVLAIRDSEDHAEPAPRDVAGLHTVLSR